MLPARQAAVCSPGVQAVEHVPIWLHQRRKEQTVEGAHCNMCAVAGWQVGVKVITDPGQAAVPHAVQVLQEPSSKQRWCWQSL